MHQRENLSCMNISSSIHYHNFSDLLMLQCHFPLSPLPCKSCSKWEDAINMAVWGWINFIQFRFGTILPDLVSTLNIFMTNNWGGGLFQCQKL